LKIGTSYEPAFVLEPGLREKVDRERAGRGGAGAVYDADALRRSADQVLRSGIDHARSVCARVQRVDPLQLDSPSAAPDPVDLAQRDDEVWKEFLSPTDWSDRDWHPQWSRQHEFEEEEAEEAEEAEHYGRHDRGRHLGWYKHHKHHGDEDDQGEDD